ncbi:MAG: hypothetical protein JNK82_06270 [Myxococcaceae bacterium]|nr:hypothetical protein [Myxococcaceae bacterium]
MLTDNTWGSGTTAVALLPSGAVEAIRHDGGLTLLHDGGVVALANGPGACRAHTGGGISCGVLANATRQPSPAFVRLIGSERKVEDLLGLLHVAAGMCGLTATGDVYCRGDNKFGQLGDRSVQPRGVVEAATPGPVEKLGLGRMPQSIDVFGSWAQTYAVANGRVWSWGSPEPLPDGGIANGLRDLGPAASIAELSPPCLRTTAGEVKCWSAPGLSVPFQGIATDALAFFGGSLVARRGTELLRGADHRVGDVRQHATPGYVLWTDGGVSSVSEWLEPIESFALPRPARTLSSSQFKQQDRERRGACAALDDGNVWCWALDRAPAPVPGAPLFPRQLVGSAEYGCALYGTNGVRCWGSNLFGQLGRDVPDVSAAAVDVAISEPIVSIETSGSHTCALTARGKVKCWGYNGVGQLGVPVMSGSQSFVQVVQ